MRQITQDAVNAFYQGSTFGRSNTTVTYGGGISGRNISEMYLFGNKIAIRDHDTGNIYFTMSDWGSVTTRERLSGLKEIAISQNRGKQILYFSKRDGAGYNFDQPIEIDPSAWYRLTPDFELSQLRSEPFFEKR